MATQTIALDNLLQNLKTLASKPLEKATAMPPEIYTSRQLHALELEKIFARQWLCAGLAASIAKPGDYLTYQINGQPLVVIRQQDNSVVAFANVCRHRMMTLLVGNGHCKRIVCPYHAWTYDTNGQLLAAPQMQHRPGFDKTKIRLATIRCEIWNGWIYLTLDKKAPAVSKLLAELNQLVAPYNMPHYVPIAQQDYVWHTNWKQLAENFMEGYHLPVAHKATVGGYFPVEDTRFSEQPGNPAFTYQRFTKTAEAPVGTAHKSNKKLTGKARRTSILPTVFPSHMFMLAPDHLWYLSLQPQGVGKVRIRFGAAMAPEVLAASKHPKRLIKETCQFLEQVNAEDRIVVEGIFGGAQAPLSTAGPLCWLERENHEFTQYLARHLCAK